MAQLQPPADQQLLIFSLSGLACALPVAAVQEIVPMPLLSYPPGASKLLDGFLNLRRTSIPVLRMHRLFDLPAAEPGLHTPVIILRTDQIILGLSVDSVTAVMDVARDKLLPVPAGNVFNDCAQAHFDEGSLTIHLLCPERLVLEQERRKIARLQTAMQDRLSTLD